MLTTIQLHGITHEVTESDLIPVEFSISTDDIKEALLFAVANGWRPRPKAAPPPPPAAEHFDTDEAPTAPFALVSA